MNNYANFVDLLNNKELLKNSIENDPQIINYELDDKTRLLHFACIKGKSEIVSLLINKGVDINTRIIWRKFTPLMLASLLGDVNICIILLSNGADLMETDITGKNSLELFANLKLFNNYEINIVQQLLESIFLNGPHPSQVYRRKNENWDRRWPMMSVFTGPGYKKTKGHLVKIFSCEDIFRIIVSYI